MIVAIIPARGGSVRIPRKNVKDFAGQPMIAYSIQAALQSRLFDRIIVSTDDLEISEVARKFGAETPFVRPAELADAHTGVIAVVSHAINWLMQQGQTVDIACCIYATAPFLQARYLVEGYRKLVATDKSFALAVTTYPFPIQRALRIRADGSLDPIDPSHIATRSQDLEESFHDAGQFCWGRARAFLDRMTVFSSVSVPVILPRYLVQDIDTPEDWTQAEIMYRCLQMSGGIGTEQSDA